jgi:hypothetical protein
VASTVASTLPDGQLMTSSHGSRFLLPSIRKPLLNPKMDTVSESVIQPRIWYHARASKILSRARSMDRRRFRHAPQAYRTIPGSAGTQPNLETWRLSRPSISSLKELAGTIAAFRQRYPGCRAHFTAPSQLSLLFRVCTAARLADVSRLRLW